MSTLTFSQLPYTRPSVETLQGTYANLTQKIVDASSAEELLAIIDEWNALRISLSTMGALAEVHFTQNVANEKAKAEKLFYDENGPAMAELEIEFVRALLVSPYVGAVEEKFGSLFLTRLRSAAKTFDGTNKELLIRESELCRKYNEITASAQIVVDGETYNLSTIGKLLIDLDADVRRKAHQAMYGFLSEHADELDTIYDKLVHIRTSKAKALGFTSYTEFRYIEFGRVDYNENDVEQFRAKVREYVVPLASQLREAQRHRLGLSELTLSDEKLQFPDGNPVATGDHDWIVERAHQMYSELSNETKEFFQLMLDSELMDLKSRDNKATGGYCTSFSQYGLPFIFANFNRTTHDIEVLTHEAGHAFQAYRSRKHPVPEYYWPTAEACEIHSMGMEFLTWPWMDRFFGEQTDKFRFYHLQGAILFLPYGCAVDEFQHWVYANPEASPAERNAKWKALESVYMPWRNSSGFAAANEGRAWQLQRHIYETPFYYIDYALAQTCALQYWKWAEQDRDAAFKSYVRICDIGGSKSFLDIVAAGELKSPFEPTTLRDIVQHTYAWLTEHYPSNLIKG